MFLIQRKFWSTPFTELLVLVITLSIFNVLMADIDHNFCALVSGGNCSDTMACWKYQNGSAKVDGYAHPQCNTSVIQNCCLYPGRDVVCYIYYTYSSPDCSGTPTYTLVGTIAGCYGDTPGTPCGS